MIPPFRQRYVAALDDSTLRRTLFEFQRGWRIARRKAIADDENFENDRSRLARAKDEMISDLAENVERFRSAAEQAGAVTYLATDGPDAIRYVVDLAQRNGATTVVKSKSMTSEEIDLNAGLESVGIRPVETDLGEWIVQLAGERPSHIVGPALHKNRRQVAEILSRATHQEVDREDIHRQVGVARTAMRTQFLAGQIGISGGNALVVETGTVVVATNEGNAELVTSLPPIHVALVGIEKLVPTLDDALLQLRLLAPSATGQTGTTYVTFFTGPSAPGREFHIVLLDNGRTQMQASPDFREALRCIRCGACSSVCPSYGVVGGHAFGYIYSGAIGLVNTAFHHGLENAAGPQSLCVSCGACATVCPVEIPLPRQILDTRARVARVEGTPLGTRSLLELWSRPNAFRLSARVSSVAQLPIERRSFLQLPVRTKFTEWRSPPAIARRPFRSRALPPPPGRDAPLSLTLQGIHVTYFVQCLTDWMFPDIGSAVADVLVRLGARVTFPSAQHCCGLVALDAGSLEPAKRMARHTIRVLERDGGDYIVTGGTSCAVAISYDYPHLFRDEPEWKERALALAARMMDFTTFMHRIARLPDGALSGDTGEPATYHYFCQSYNVLKFREEPLHLVRDICGVRLAPLEDANVCCGFGGSVSLNRPEMCRHILDRKLANVDNTGARVLITDNPGCIMHLRGGIEARRGPVRVLHTAQVVSRSLAHHQDGPRTGR